MKTTRQLVALVFALFATAALASAIPGRAEVKKVIGSATVDKAAGGRSSITEGMVLGAGDTISTGPGSTVDLWLGLNGDALRVDPDSTLKLATLDIANVANRTVNTGLSVTKGSIVGNVVNKLTAASKYEIKTASGVAGIRGTIYRLNANGTLVVLTGMVNFTFTLNGVTQTVQVTSGKQFKPGDTAPSQASAATLEDIRQEVRGLATNTGTVTSNGGTANVTNPLDNSTSSK